MLLNVRIEERPEGDTLILYRKEVVATPRGRTLEEVTILTLTDAQIPMDVFEGRGAELSCQVTGFEQGTGTLSLAMQVRPSAHVPVDPKVPLTGFGDPSDAETKKRKARGMSWKAAAEPSKPVGTPPVPKEQQRGRVGGHRVMRGMRRH